MVGVYSTYLPALMIAGVQKLALVTSLIVWRFFLTKIFSFLFEKSNTNLDADNLSAPLDSLWQ